MLLGFSIILSGFVFAKTFAQWRNMRDFERGLDQGFERGVQQAQGVFESQITKYLQAALPDIKIKTSKKNRMDGNLGFEIILSPDNFERHKGEREE